MRVRRRRSRDLAACTRLLRLITFEGRYPDLQSAGALRAWLEAEDVLDAWVAVDEGRLVGHITIATLGHDPVSALRWREVTGRDPSDLAGVSRFFVRPRARGKGVGAALLESAVAGIRERGLLPVLETVSDASGGITLLDTLGWHCLAVDYAPGSSRHRVHRYAAPRPAVPPRAIANPLALRAVTASPVAARPVAASRVAAHPGGAHRLARTPLSLRLPIAARASRRP